MDAEAQEKDQLAPYRFHGVDFREVKNGEAIATCPFGCADDSRTGQGHFFVNKKTGKCSCKKCGFEGNTYTFLTKLWKNLLHQTTRKHLEALSENRGGLPWSAFKAASVAYDDVGDRYLIPVTNGKGSLANLLAFAPNSEHPKPIGTTGCAQHLMGLSDLKESGPIYLTEGPWKRIALLWLLEKVGLDPNTYSVLSTLGAANFKKEWIEHFRKRDVILLFDHDTAGAAGMDKIQKLLLPVASSIRRIVWPATTEEKYGVNDFIADNRQSPKQAWKQLKSYLPQTQAERPNKLVRKTFKEVLKDFRSKINGISIIHVNKTFEDILAVVIAVAVSAKLVEKDPIWLFLVGPPGIGKTLLIHSFMSASISHYLSCLTKSQLVSGWQKNDDGQDPSVLDKLRNKCLFVEDYTTIKTMPLGAQEELYGLLRSVYNGKYDQQFGNYEIRSYENLYFSMVAGVTDIIHGDQRATLGERFLKIDMAGDDLDEHTHLLSALNPILGNVDPALVAKKEQQLRDSVAAFLDRELTPAKLPKVPDWFVKRIIPLARLGARLRAHVQREHGSLLYRPRAELGTRLVKQLTKLARFVAFVLGTRIDDRTYRIVQKVALDTVVGFNLEILNALYKSKDGLILPEIGIHLQISHSSIDRKLQDLQELGVVFKQEEIKKDKRGRRYYLWQMADEIRQFWKEAAIQYTPPKNALTSRKGYVQKVAARKRKKKVKR